MFGAEETWPGVALAALSGIFVLAQAWLAWRRSAEFEGLKKKADQLEQKVKRNAVYISKLRRVMVRMRQKHTDELAQQERNWHWDRLQKHYYNNCTLILMAKLKELGAEVELPPMPTRPPETLPPAPPDEKG